MAKDWSGNKANIFVTNGCTGHAQGDREVNDFYATDKIAAELLLEIEPQLNNIWENAVGQGHLAEVFRERNLLNRVSDLVDRGYYPENIPTLYGKDFLKIPSTIKYDGDIVTNPPFAHSSEWVEKCLDILEVGRYLVLFMKITFCEGKKRKSLFAEKPPIRVWVSSSRINCAKGGDFEKYGKGSAACYCWYVWQKGYQGSTELKWFN